MIRLTSVASLTLPSSESLVSTSFRSTFAFAMSWLLAGAVLLQPTRAEAQQASGIVESVAPSAPVGPVQLQSATYRPIVVELPGESPKAAVVQSTDRNNVAWMAVGAATLMVGLLIGGDAGTVMAVTGGVIGLVGLFRYMR